MTRTTKSTQDGSASRALVLLSGGLDSLACVAFARAAGFDTTALFVDYGQAAAAREGEAVDRLSRRLQLSVQHVTLTGVSVLGGFIPGRNAVLLSVALMAAPFHSGVFLIGIHDGTGYADCEPGFVDRMQGIFDLYAEGRVRILAPFAAWTKGDIWNYLATTDFPADMTYSCELGLDQPCGGCRTCADLVVLHAR